MNRRLISVLLFAFVMAGAASLVLYHLVINRVHAAAPVATTTIVVAAKDLQQGVVIDNADVTSTPWAGTIPKGALTKPGDVIGRGVAAPVFAGEPVTEGRLLAKGAGGGLASTIPPGMRAVAVRVNEVAGVAGFVVAGTHVDVLVSGTTPGSDGAPGTSFTRTLLEDVSVLSAGQDYKRDAEGKPASVQVVNLLVTPEQAQMLSLASGSMTMQLVLRNPLDKVKAAARQVTLASILDEAHPEPQKAAVRPRPMAAVHPVLVAPPPDTPAPPRVSKIEIIEGNKRTDATVQKVEVR